VVLPWRRDPHGDHRATWHLFRAAVTDGPAPHFFEYPIWVWDLGDPADHPGPEVRGYRLDVSTVLARKRTAIRQHLSQLTDLIDDDPTGFRLQPKNLAHFDHPWELYYEEAPIAAP
ncbi:MAG: PIG-L family deacetylase, partial [Catalinimonas sp.]